MNTLRLVIADDHPIFRAGLRAVLARSPEIQVVAGLNYRICMRVREGRRAVRTATAVVYRDLRKRMSLTRWKNGACTDL